jgi:hypothetical protein
MDLPYDSFLKIAKQVQTLSKYVVTMDVNIDKTNEYVNGKYIPTVNVAYLRLVFDSVANMHAYNKQLPIPTHNLRIQSPGDILEDRPKTLVGPPDVKGDKELSDKISEISGWEETHTMRMLNSTTAKLEPTVKLIPEETLVMFRPHIIKRSPLEITEGDYTYRILTSQDDRNYTPRIRVIARNDEPLYDYLDKGFFLMTIQKEKDNGLKEPTFVVSDSYDVNTAHVFMMCKIQHNLTDLLKDGCFISKYEAELTKLKMLKKLTPEAKQLYLKNVKAVDEDYRKNTTLVVVGKLMSGEIERTTIRDITFSKTLAKYENTEIEADDLLALLSEKLDFNGEFDIYAVIQNYANHIQGRLCSKIWHDHELNDIEQGNNELKKKALPSFKINDITITASVGYKGQRYLNDIRINMDEVAQAIYRASCYRSAEDYDLFLKSISRMSIKRHDIIANGLQVKIHAGMTNDEYRNEIPGVNAPALKFVIDKDDKRIKLYIDAERQVAVNLGDLIKKVKTINTRTNNRGYTAAGYNYWKNRDHLWAAEQLAQALIETTTFTVNTTKEDGTVEEKKTVLISKEDVTKLLQVVEEQSKAKIERSKQFLDTAVKLTGAEQIEFMGQKAYKVRGSLREYAVVVSNAKVYDYETKQYRCIVNDRHYKGAGYDDIASRLLALKNDSVMQDQIGTLRGMAQPNAENVHNDYRPERDVEEVLTPLVDKVFEKIS